MFVPAAIVSALLGAMFLATSGGKLADNAQAVETRDHLGISPTRWRLIGLLELAGAVGVLAGLAARPLGIAAAAGLLLVALGALATHIRIGDKLGAALPALVALVLAAAAVSLQAAA